MPTTRKRRTRGAADGIPNELYHFFAIGTGHNPLEKEHGAEYLRAMWNKYGHQFLSVYPYRDGETWGEMCFGAPQPEEVDRAD